MSKTNKPSPTKYNTRVVEYNPPKFARSHHTTGAIRSPVVSGVYVREVKHHPSLETPGGSTTRQEAQKYSGDLCQGISLVHKSGFAPVFSKDEAIDFAHMRR